MHTTNTLIIGAGQAGLALSQRLTEHGCDHVVLDRGQVAERWHSERWDSLRLLSPNWMTRLPGFRYDGDDPEGFMTAPEVASFFRRYAASFEAPVLDHTTVRRVTHDGEHFVVESDRGTQRSHHVVVATGWCDQPAVPLAGRCLSPRIEQVTATEYRRPDDLPTGGVLVVGASATGVQLAHELQQSGRSVTLAVGNHARMPRRYRGMDSFWWLDQLGSFDRTVDDVDDVLAIRSEPSLQLVGRPDHRTLDLASLQRAGVRLVGRLERGEGSRVGLATDVASVIAAADERMAQQLARIDTAIDRLGLTAEVLDPEPMPPVRPFVAPDELDLEAAGISTVVWATGYRRSYDWLQLPIFDGRGEIRQYRGVTPFPGAYVLGLRFQHFRNSNFIDGVGRDATFVADHIVCGRTDRADATPHSSGTKG
jgi:putative flavoprotein involved in K+ transport